MQININNASTIMAPKESFLIENKKQKKNAVPAAPPVVLESVLRAKGVTVEVEFTTV